MAKKKPYLAKTRTEPIVLMALLSSKSKCKLCMQQSEAVIDSTLIQWHTGIVRMTVLESPMMLGDPVGRQSYFRVSVPLLITTLLKCSGSTCAHWRPSSWWRSRRPPSLPMPRNGTASMFAQIVRDPASSTEEVSITFFYESLQIAFPYMC